MTSKNTHTTRQQEEKQDEERGRRSSKTLTGRQGEKDYDVLVLLVLCV